MQGEGPQVTQGREEVQGLWSRSKPRQFHAAFHMRAPSFPGVLALPPQPGPLAPLPWASEKGVVEAYLRLAPVSRPAQRGHKALRSSGRRRWQDVAWVRRESPRGS